MPDARERRDAQAGAFAAVFLGAQAYLERERGAGNWQHAAAAGGFTAGLFGFLSARPKRRAGSRCSAVLTHAARVALRPARAVPSGVAARLQGLAAGVCVGAGVAAPLGALQAELAAQVAAQGGAQTAGEGPARPQTGAAARAIQQLESSLDEGK